MRPGSDHPWGRWGYHIKHFSPRWSPNEEAAVSTWERERQWSAMADMLRAACEAAVALERKAHACITRLVGHPAICVCLADGTKVCVAQAVVRACGDDGP